MTRDLQTRFFILRPAVQILGIAALCLLILTGTAVQATAQDGLFSIQGIKVDITAESAAAAREKAFTQAQTTAFRKLTTRLLSGAEQEQLTIPEPRIISSFVNDFEITEERLSSVRYSATYNFRFKNDAVRNYLSGQGLSYTDVGSQPVLVLPYYRQGGSVRLWNGENPWLESWNNQGTSQGLVTIVVPIGDLADLSAINDKAPLTYNPEDLDQMIDRYRAGDALIVIATPHSMQDSLPGSLEVAMYHTADGPQFSQTLMVTGADIQNNETIFEAAARIVREKLQSDWKNKTLVDSSQRDALKVRARFQSLREWADMQKTLPRVQGIDDIELLSLSPTEAYLRLRYQGSERRLRLALAQADITLSAPQIDFAATSGSQHSYKDRRYQDSPLIYDIYLNKYRH